MARVTSPRASSSTLPCSLVRMAARSSACSSSSALRRNMQRARRNGGWADHSGNALEAAFTAASSSSAVPIGTRLLTRPVAGLYTSPVRSLADVRRWPSIKCSRISTLYSPVSGRHHSSPAGPARAARPGERPGISWPGPLGPARSHSPGRGPRPRRSPSRGAH